MSGTFDLTGWLGGLGIGGGGGGGAVGGDAPLGSDGGGGDVTGPTPAGSPLDWATADQLAGAGLAPSSAAPSQWGGKLQAALGSANKAAQASKPAAAQFLQSPRATAETHGSPAAMQQLAQQLLQRQQTYRQAQAQGVPGPVPWTAGLLGF
jgi:hypothetical protein